MLRPRYFPIAGAAIVVSLTSSALSAQAITGTDSVAGSASEISVGGPHRLLTIGSVAEDRLRVHELSRDESGGSVLVRSPSSASSAIRRGGSGSALAVLAPELRTAWNSALPFSFNDGALWAGRGLSIQLMAGFRAELGPATLIVAPQVAHQQNREFQVIPFTVLLDPSRHPLSSPWYARPETLDLPSRFGEDPFTTLGPGQSSLSLSFGAITAGAATENLWWGPGIRNAIVMSNHAAGIPHLFLRTGAPISTPLGDVEGRWILGRLRESEYFDSEPTNDVRSLSALALVLSPAVEPNLSLGFARAVYAPVRDGAVPLVAALHVFGNVGRPNSRPATDLLRERGPDQVFSLFARWLFPAAGFEAYGEWARYEQPASLRDFLVFPHHSQGYTVGLQWARPAEHGSVVRLQAEATYLEPSATFRQRRVISWYASRPVPQGYTHRGQVIGASIGPGASSQWVAADYFAGNDAQIGIFGGRIRWDNSAFYTVTPHPFFAHDVSIFLGLRAAYQLFGMDLAAEISTGKRLNYLYQNPSETWEDELGVDIVNRSVRFSITPRGER